MGSDAETSNIEARLKLKGLLILILECKTMNSLRTYYKIFHDLRIHYVRKREIIMKKLVFLLVSHDSSNSIFERYN